MDKKSENYLRLLELAQGRSQYQDFLEEYEALNRRMLRTMEQLKEPEKSAIEDYLGHMAMFGNFMLLLACENMEFPKE